VADAFDVELTVGPLRGLARRLVDELR